MGCTAALPSSECLRSSGDALLAAHSRKVPQSAPVMPTTGRTVGEVIYSATTSGRLSSAY